MLCEAPLIKVKAMSRSMAKQVTVLAFSDDLCREIIKAFQADTCRPLAWCQGEVLDGIPDNTRAWLVEYEGTLYWITAPYKGRCGDGTPEWMQTCTRGLQQVFVG